MVIDIAPPHGEVLQVLLLRFTTRTKTGMQPRSIKLPGPPNVFTAQGSCSWPPPQTMNRATIPLALTGRNQSPRFQRKPRYATTMKYYDCVSQYAVNRFLEPLRSVRIYDEREQILHLIKTVGLEATVYVCTACAVVSWSTTGLNFIIWRHLGQYSTVTLRTSWWTLEKNVCCPHFKNKKKHATFIPLIHEIKKKQQQIAIMSTHEAFKRTSPHTKLSLDKKFFHWRDPNFQYLEHLIFIHIANVQVLCGRQFQHCRRISRGIASRAATCFLSPQAPSRLFSSRTSFINMANGEELVFQLLESWNLRVTPPTASRQGRLHSPRVKL